MEFMFEAFKKIFTKGALSHLLIGVSFFLVARPVYKYFDNVNETERVVNEMKQQHFRDSVNNYQDHKQIFTSIKTLSDAVKKYMKAKPRMVVVKENYYKTDTTKKVAPPEEPVKVPLRDFHIIGHKVED
jgi:hypothetical protein